MYVVDIRSVLFLSFILSRVLYIIRMQLFQHSILLIFHAHINFFVFFQNEKIVLSI